MKHQIGLTLEALREKKKEKQELGSSKWHTFHMGLSKKP